MLYKIIIFIIFITKALSYNLNYNTRFDITFNKNYVDCIYNLMDLRMDKSSILLKNKYEYIIDSYDYNNKNNYLFNIRSRPIDSHTTEWNVDVYHNINKVDDIIIAKVIKFWLVSKINKKNEILDEELLKFFS